MDSGTISFLIGMAIIGLFIFTGKEDDNQIEEQIEPEMDPAEEYCENGFCEKATKRLIVCLDIDGVLHKAENGSLEYKQNLSKLLNKDISIVFSTNWKRTMSYKSLKSLFDEDVADRIVGYTGETLKQESTRYYEIIEWMEKHARNKTWIALDDTASLFPDNCANLFLIDRYIGLDDETVKRLSAHIDQL
ncbi:hypothetical protein A3715_34035, partial [Oleiphilus sp. HI0009]